MVEKLNDLAKLDFLKTLFWNLNVSKRNQEVLTPQSIQGHIQSGHGVFSGNAEENTFIEDVFNLIGKKPVQARGDRQKIIEDCFWLADRIVDGKAKYLLGPDGEPILGFSPVKDEPISCHRKVAKGIALMGSVDDYFWRQDTMNFYQNNLAGEKLNIGYGKEYLVDLDVMKRMGHTLTSLSEKAYSKKDIAELRREGLIKKEAGKNIENIFIRRNEGLGCCDDMMLCSIGLIHGADAMLGGWLCDGIDTYTKFVKDPKESGYDQVLGSYIQKKWMEKYGEELVSPGEIREIIYLGAKENFPKINLSSSHRRFIQTEKGQKFPTIINHLNYIRGDIRPKNYQLGFTKVDSDVFYDTLEERFVLFGKENCLPHKNVKK